MNKTKQKTQLKVNSEMEKVINLIVQYANSDLSFEKNDGFSLDKGLWICGNFGSGKTLLIEAYKEFMRRMNVNVGFQTCSDMNMRFIQKNEITGNIAKFDGIKTFSNRFDKVERIFDDLGEEETYVMDFGNKVCIMAHILSERYKGKIEGVKTHITT